MSTVLRKLQREVFVLSLAEPANEGAGPRRFRDHVAQRHGARSRNGPSAESE